jgi:hypothetical protein
VRLLVDSNVLLWWLQADPLARARNRLVHLDNLDNVRAAERTVNGRTHESSFCMSHLLTAGAEDL